MPFLKEIMTDDVFTTSKDATVAEVATSMLKGRFGSAVVMDGSWVSGIFTERDVLRAAASGRDLTASSVADWMTVDPVTVEGGIDADEAAELMMSNGFRHLPVVEGQTLLGIVSLRDVLRTRIRRPSS
ncbi:MAG TPA: CBS domain-containing protein [Actinomycetota bacterium]|nr:CBS domain-containing protein [Actinomycetota bacterium]